MSDESEAVPNGRIVITGDDIGVVGAVTVEVDGVVVCRLNPTQAVRTLDQNGYGKSTLTFGAWPVEWRDKP
jgi:hypothetical protein